MNKVDWVLNGGFPELLDDLEFEQNAVREAFYGLMTAFGVSGPESFVISGCGLSGGSYQSGFICLEGEILRFDGSAPIAVSPPNMLAWAVLETNDPEGTKIMENTLTREAYKVRRARIEIIDIADSAGRFAVDPNGATIASKIASMSALTNKYSLKAQPVWRSIGALGQPAFENGWINDNFFDGPAQFRKSDTGLVTLRGAVKNGSRYRMWLMPPDCIPPYNIQIAVSGAPAGDYITKLSISNSGDVQALGFDGINAPPNVSLCGVSYYVD